MVSYLFKVLRPLPRVGGGGGCSLLVVEVVSVGDDLADEADTAECGEANVDSGVVSLLLFALLVSSMDALLSRGGSGGGCDAFRVPPFVLLLLGSNVESSVS